MVLLTAHLRKILVAMKRRYDVNAVLIFVMFPMRRKLEEQPETYFSLLAVNQTWTHFF